MNNNVTNHITFYQSLLPSRIFKLLYIYYHFPAVTYVRVYSMGKDTLFNNVKKICKNFHSCCVTFQYSHYFLFNPGVHRVLNCVYRHPTMNFNEPAINSLCSDFMCFQESCEKRLFKINP
jgi:hypothetical protein